MNATLTFHVQAGAKRSEVVGWHGDAIKIRIAAPPVDFAANAELLRFLAKRLGIPRSAIHLVAGGHRRRKRVAIEGVGQVTALAQLGVGVTP